MVVGIARVTLYLEAADSLKEKRRVIKSLLQRIHNRFNVGAAEVSDLDDHRIATLGITCVSNSGPHCDEVLANVVSFIERNVELGQLGEVETELIHW
jgi:uncharacterized protein YlxP (DUF503 family)